MDQSRFQRSCFHHGAELPRHRPRIPESRAQLSQRRIVTFASSLTGMMRAKIRRTSLVLLTGAAALAQQIETAGSPGPTTSGSVQIRGAGAEYTTEALAARLQGTVALYLFVDPEGKPSRIKVLHGLGLGLDEKAVEAVQQWQFKPAISAGQPVGLGRSANIYFGMPGGGPWRIRLAAYKVIRDRRRLETLTKPVLSHYAAPDPEACPISGGRAILTMVVGADGIPQTVTSQTPTDPVSAAAVKAVESWRFLPGTANGEPREANSSVELECGPALPIGVDSFVAPGTVVTQPAVVIKVDPDYAEEARKAKLSGSVTLRAIVDPTGHAVEVEVIRPLGPGLDENAVEAVEQWRFKPGAKDGKAVNVRVTIEVNFRLL